MSPPLFQIVAADRTVTSELVESAERVLPLIPARHRRRLRDALPELGALDALARNRRHAQRLQNRLFGRLADCVIEPGPHTLGALMHGLSLLRTFLFLRRIAPTRTTPNRRAHEADLQMKVGGRWLNIDIRPRNPGGRADDRYLILDHSDASEARAGHLPRIEGYLATFRLFPGQKGGGDWRLVGEHLLIEDIASLDTGRGQALSETLSDIQQGFTPASA